MSHEVNLNKFNLRTDLIDEISTKNKEINKDNIKINDIYLTKEEAKIIKKKEGRYITISFNDITDIDSRNKIINIFKEILKKLIKNLTIKESCLVIGLGNIKSTADSLGPKTIENIITTKHIYDYSNLDKGFKIVSSFIPGVTGITGIDTFSLIKSVIKTVKPDFVIVIDSLKASNIDRLNKTIQITDTGIHPGSGVGSNRKELSYKTLKIPVIAIGVPTVINASNITSNYMNNNINDMIVTPKEIDFIIDNLSYILSNGINMSLHKKLDK